MAIVQLLVSENAVVVLASSYDEVTRAIGELEHQVNKGETFAGKTFDELKQLGTGEHELPLEGFD